MSKGKINPRRIPRTEADVIRAKNDGADFGMTFCIKVFLYVLKNRHQASNEDILQLRDEFCYELDSFNRGDISLKDIDGVLEDEFKLHVRLT